MNIRPYQPDDAAELMQLFYDTVHQVNIRDYTPEQVNAWAPPDRDLTQWTQSFAGKFVFVAEQSGHLAGFAELEPNGHIDRFFCHKDFQGQGVGTLLMHQLEAQAQALNLQRLFVEVSITARPFFERKGFTLICPEEVERHGQTFLRFRMEKV